MCIIIKEEKRSKHGSVDLGVGFFFFFPGMEWFRRRSGPELGARSPLCCALIRQCRGLIYGPIYGL